MSELAILANHTTKLQRANTAGWAGVHERSGTRGGGAVDKHAECGDDIHNLHASPHPTLYMAHPPKNLLSHGAWRVAS